MSYTTQQDILDFVEDNNVKFVRFAFCDIFGFQKNIAVLASDLPKALEDGVCFDGSAIAGFMHVEESDLVLRPDLSTMTILPWRTAEGRVMQFFCDVEKPDNTPFGGNCRGFLRDINRRFKQLGLRCNVGTVDLESILPDSEDEAELTGLLREHLQRTGSPRAKAILDDWTNERAKFVKVFPVEYRQALGRMAREDAEAVDRRGEMN